MIHDSDCPCVHESAAAKRQSDAVALKLSELQSDYDHAWQDREAAQERMNAAQKQAQALGVALT